MASRSGRLACCCIACLAAVSSGRFAKADPEQPSRSARHSAILNQPLGEASPHPRLAKGDSGPDVERLQKLLDKERKARGAPAIAMDGDYGSGTESAVRAFQERHGLPATGTVDDATWQRLESIGAPPPLETPSTPANHRPSVPAKGPAAPAKSPAPSTPSPSTAAPSTTIGAVGALDKGVKGVHAPMKLSAAALDSLARIVEAEAGVCSEEGKIAVAAVVLNRVRAGYADGTVQGVIREPAQFTAYGDSTYKSKPSQASIAAAEAAASGQDPSNGATFYYNPYLVSPSWARGMKQVARIGTNRTNTHVFFKG